MPLIRQRRWIFLLTALFVIALSLVGMKPAEAAPACYNGTCRGLDPNTATNYQGVKCTVNAYNKVTFYTPGIGTNQYKFELRYSPTCMSVWTRVTTLSGAVPGSCYGTWATTATYTHTKQFAYSSTVGAVCGAGNSTWTNMSPFDGVFVRACHNPNGSLGAPGTAPYWTCSGYY